jgi:hypothetical protein
MFGYTFNLEVISINLVFICVYLWFQILKKGLRATGLMNLLGVGSV